MPCVLLEPEAQGSEMILLPHETKPQQVLGNVSKLFKADLKEQIERDQPISYYSVGGSSLKKCGRSSPTAPLLLFLYPIFLFAGSMLFQETRKGIATILATVAIRSWDSQSSR